MVTKKYLLNRINVLEQEKMELSIKIKELYSQIENDKTIIDELSKKIEFLWKHNEYEKKKDKEMESIFDEWINGKSGGEN